MAEALLLDTVEINPLRVDGGQIDGLDALVVSDKDEEQQKEIDL